MDALPVGGGEQAAVLQGFVAAVFGQFAAQGLPHQPADQFRRTARGAPAPFEKLPHLQIQIKGRAFELQLGGVLEVCP